MAGAGPREPGEEALRLLATTLRSVAAGVDVRRAALGPAALEWWAGPAADRARAEVAERSAGLARVADDLREAAAEAEHLAARVRAASGQGSGPGAGS